MIKRIIDKTTKLFIRDDFEFNPETEMELEVEPAQGFYLPKWNGKEWVEGKTSEEIEAIKASASQPEPDEMEVLKAEVATLKSKLADIEKTDTVKAELIAMKEVSEPIIKK